MLTSTNELAGLLARLSVAAPEKVLCADSGYQAVEAALDTALAWWRARGEVGRRSFICVEGASHSDTLSATSYRAPAGDCAHLERLLGEHRGAVAGVIVEPLPRAAELMLRGPGYLEQLRRACDCHDVLLICDETRAAVGRTGTTFAYQRENVTPDLLCLADGLTDGVVGLGALLMWISSPDATIDPSPVAGNLVAAAAAVERLERLACEGVIARLAERIELLGLTLGRRVSVLPTALETRQIGLMAGVLIAGGEVVADQVRLAAARRGVRLEGADGVVELLPELDVRETELCRQVAVLASSIAEVAVGRLPAAA